MPLYRLSPADSPPTNDTRSTKCVVAPSCWNQMILFDRSGPFSFGKISTSTKRNSKYLSSVRASSKRKGPNTLLSTIPAQTSFNFSRCWVCTTTTEQGFYLPQYLQFCRLTVTFNQCSDGQVLRGLR